MKATQNPFMSTVGLIIAGGIGLFLLPVLPLLLVVYYLSKND